jgi:hypothetical protein
VATEELPEHTSMHLSLLISPYALVCDGIPTSPAPPTPGIDQDYSCRGCPRGPHPFRRQGERGNYPHYGRRANESVPVVDVRRGG